MPPANPRTPPPFPPLPQTPKGRRREGSKASNAGKEKEKRGRSTKGKFMLLQVRRKSIPFSSFPYGSALIWIRF
jgi:hypothetical protein